MVIVVAVQAHRVRHGRGEIARRMTARTRQAFVPPFQREVGFIMIKGGPARNVHPAACLMTVDASCFKGSDMRVRVACTTHRKGDTYILRGGFGGRSSRMTSITGYGLMQSGERKAARIVIEPDCRSPGIEAVTGSTVLRQLTLMFVLMTRETRRRKTEVSSVQVGEDNPLRLGRRYVLAGVALTAGRGSVFAHQWIPRFSMVERVSACWPTDDVEVAPKMLGVAARAVLAAVRRPEKSRMVSALGDNSLLDVRVTCRALEFSASPQCMAARALKQAV
jgi:hypothetical protein